MTVLISITQQQQQQQKPIEFKNYSRFYSALRYAVIFVMFSVLRIMI